MIMGKIDTSNGYLAVPIFGGDLSNENDDGNVGAHVVALAFG